ncbi:MAG: phosphotransferase [Alphaproteobacteria bacterium]|nr:phosphotransferase [Alphaproteobacteria bacterium]
MSEREFERNRQRREFVDASGWRGGEIVPRPGDASTRSYARVHLNGRTAMLMDQPQSAEAPAAPADATPAERHALGYNAVARLAGADCGRFIAVSNYLRGLGLSAPEIYAADCGRGLVLIEDLGDDLYAEVLRAGGDERELYEAAAEVLARLHDGGAPDAMGDRPLYAYDETALLAEIELMTQWFLPLALKRETRPDEVDEHRALWREAIARARDAAPVFVHRDYHAQNLIWLPKRDGVARVGLIDFQDAVAGARSYDLISLIEDARRDVAPEIAEATTRHYLDAAGRDEDAYRAQMAVMAAQRNAKIAGIFARLHKRDGKPRYLSYLPRVWGYLNRDLDHPALARLKSWYDRTIPREARGAIDGATA